MTACAFNLPPDPVAPRSKAGQDSMVHTRVHATQWLLPFTFSSPNCTVQATPLAAQWNPDHGATHYLGSLKKIEAKVPDLCEPAHMCLAMSQELGPWRLVCVSPGLLLQFSLVTRMLRQPVKSGTVLTNLGLWSPYL